MFDSLDRDKLWKHLQHYAIPNAFISMIRNTYENKTCWVIYAGQGIYSFMVKIEVRQRCFLSPFLLLLAIDHEKRLQQTEEMGSSGHLGASWWTRTLPMTSLSCPTASHQQMQEKPQLLNTVSTQLRLNINRNKTKIKKTTHTHTTPSLWTETH